MWCDRCSEQGCARLFKDCDALAQESCELLQRAVKAEAERDALKAQIIPEADREQEWQPIATAPKGSWPHGPQDTRHPAYVAPPRLWLLLDDGEPCVGYFDAYYAEGGNGCDGGSPWVEKFSGERVRPTHWMPLPDPPKEAR